MSKTETRRSFFRRGWLFVLAIGTGGGNVHFYSAGSKVGQWAGWIENSAGKVVAFFTRSGEIVRWTP